ncbi:hypothetical protein J2795_001519 [Chryseobacterium bernardetii]|uniref:Uncharacterized protein n=2 Tax=Chryseobacterium TaxID=59732 RepID=A0A543EIW3_9FLAO|nr:hypothetical protein [Chryseobacterium vietnamense]MDR6440819.1 hypothetical protein [Chryseobacterium bernardetii]TQM21502.1 hypothetical protein FB551_1191 [Chryseobacterium aquifrigidense]
MIKKKLSKKHLKTLINRHFLTLASILQNNSSLIERLSDTQIVKLKK